MERTWNKFLPVFGPDFKVGLETTFPKGAAPVDLDPLYEKSELIHDPPGESIVRVYEPAVVIGSCRDGGEKTHVLFAPVSQKGSLFRRIVFARKIGDNRQPRLWMAVGRRGEAVPFGFDALSSQNQRYLSLAYPGVSGVFEPTYVKIRDVNGNFVYLELWTNDDEVKILVTACRVDEKSAPEHLRLATLAKIEEKVPLKATMEEIATV